MKDSERMMMLKTVTGQLSIVGVRVNVGKARRGPITVASHAGFDRRVAAGFLE